MVWVMEGQLWKWTNYWNGWQSRWFILSDNGVLSYYKSCEEVDQGCKGSMNVAACEIVVNSSDSTRLDVIISNEQSMYLRAVDEKERQKWLIALGSAKACMNKTSRRIFSCIPSPLQSSVKESRARVPLNAENLECKRSELKLYLDLLMKQAHATKETVADPSNGVDGAKLIENASVLCKTCDVFMEALEEVVRIADGRLTQSHSLNVGDTSLLEPSSNVREDHKSSFGKSHPTDGGLSRKCSDGDRNSSASCKRHHMPPHPKEISSVDKTNGFQALFGSNIVSTDTPEIGDLPPSTCNSGIREEGYRSLGPNFPESGSNHTEINTTEFLMACKGASVIFDMLGVLSFAPLRMDMKFLIAGVERKVSVSSSHPPTLQCLISDEMREGEVENGDGSATEYLFKLLHYLMFIHNFLGEVIQVKEDKEWDKNEDESVRVCLTSAYDNTSLSQNLSPVIQNAFKVALQSSPPRATFLSRLYSLDHGVVLKSSSESCLSSSVLYQVKCFPQLASYLDSMEKCLVVLLKFFRDQGLFKAQLKLM